MDTNWNQKHFEAMEKIFPPARPSASELNEYRKEISKLKHKLKRNLGILILGTTIEYIDFALKENMNITIIDSSEEYCHAILDKANFKYSPNIKIVTDKWEEMRFSEQFDVVIGDCVVGNIEQPKLEEFIKRVNKSLRPQGIFLGKNFLAPNHTHTHTVGGRNM